MKKIKFFVFGLILFLATSCTSGGGNKNLFDIPDDSKVTVVYSDELKESVAKTLGVNSDASDEFFEILENAKITEKKVKDLENLYKEKESTINPNLDLNNKSDLDAVKAVYLDARKILDDNDIGKLVYELVYIVAYSSEYEDGVQNPLTVLTRDDIIVVTKFALRMLDASIKDVKPADIIKVAENEFLTAKEMATLTKSYADVYNKTINSVSDKDWHQLFDIIKKVFDLYTPLAELNTNATTNNRIYNNFKQLFPVYLRYQVKVLYEMNEAFYKNALELETTTSEARYNELSYGLAKIVFTAHDKLSKSDKEIIKTTLGDLLKLAIEIQGGNVSEFTFIINDPIGFARSVYDLGYKELTSDNPKASTIVLLLNVIKLIELFSIDY